jgi:hypothetical protein
LRTVFIVFGLLAVLMIGLTLRATNSNRDLLSYTGKWKGGFTVDAIEPGPNTETDRRRSRLEGYLQVYLTRRSYKLHLEGEQQGIDVDGTWTVKEGRVTLTPKEVKIDDQGGESKRDPNKKYIPNEAVTAAYNRPLVLVLAPDKRSYQGLPTTVGTLLGKHHFEKDGP